MITGVHVSHVHAPRPSGREEETTMNLAPEYEKCADCWHFVDLNPAYRDAAGLAEYVHLDNGEKEHDHDARPGGVRGTLAAWKAAHPQLFTRYPDGNIGPNSAHFEPPV
jgi:hypothetical protein